MAAAGVAWRERWERRVRSVEGTGAGEREHAMGWCGGAASGGAVKTADVAEPIAHVSEPIARDAVACRPVGRIIRGCAL